MPRWNLLAIGNKRVAPERQIVFPAGDLPNSSDHANGVSRNAISPVGTSRHFAAMLVFTHPFFASSGEHGKGKAYEPMARVMPVLYEQGATVLVTGHDHVLEQFATVDGTGKLDAAKGVRSFVVGTGGATLYTTFAKHPRSEHFSNKSKGFLRLMLYRDGYKWSFVAVDGPVVNLPVGGETCNRKPPA